MKAVAVIPARYASTRLPGKPLADICGRPMVQWVWERASRARGVSRVIVATDDERVVAAVHGFGGEVLMTSRRHRSGTDRVEEVARMLSCDVVLNVQGDEPLLDPRTIERLLSCFAQDPHTDMATPVCPIRTAGEYLSPHIVKAIVGLDGRALYFTRSPAPFFRDGLQAGHSGVSVRIGVPPSMRSQLGRLPVRRHLGMYGYRKDFLHRLVEFPPSPLERAEQLEQLRVLENGFTIKTVRVERPSAAVDTPADLAVVRRQVRVLHGGRPERGKQR
jgi:3-deoxy-manno-octulosonate cytidylyltransferase (CMP-KDO synthetase)